MSVIRTGSMQKSVGELDGLLGQLPQAMNRLSRAEEELRQSLLNTDASAGVDRQALQKLQQSIEETRAELEEALKLLPGDLALLSSKANQSITGR